VSAFYPNSIANPELGWETTTQSNVGLDFGMIENRFTLTLDWYQKETRDLLLPVTLTPNSGFNSATMNFGKVTNTGFEVALGADIFVNAFKWHMDVNVSRNVNEVTDIGDLGRIFGANISGDFKWREAALVEEGQHMGVFAGVRRDGIFRDWEDVQTWQGGFMYNEADPEKGAIPGDRRFFDVPDPETGEVDGQLTVQDREIIGNPPPDFIVGWTNSFAYGNFDLTMFWQGAVGHDVLNVNRYQLFGNAVTTRNAAPERYTNRWTPDNPDAEWPRLGANQPVGDNIESWIIEKGDFMRLRNLTL
jgi:hypothetical protein